jgi:hypothetical protein
MKRQDTGRTFIIDTYSSYSVVSEMKVVIMDEVCTSSIHRGGEKSVYFRRKIPRLRTT